MGVRASSPIDLIAIGLSRRESDLAGMEPIARKVLQRFGSLRSLAEAGPADIATASGLEEFETTRVMALIELGRRCGNSARGPVTTIDGPEDVYDLLQYLQGEKREHFVAILMDAKGRVMRVAEVHIGTLTASIVGAREVFREAIRDGASSLIVAHNHPSGDPTPSPEDIEVTKKLFEIGEMLDIPLLDHVIIGERSARSLREGVIESNLGRNHRDVAYESTRHARSPGIGAWALP